MFLFFAVDPVHEPVKPPLNLWTRWAASRNAATTMTGIDRREGTGIAGTGPGIEDEESLRG